MSAGTPFVAVSSQPSDDTRMRSAFSSAKPSISNARDSPVTSTVGDTDCTCATVACSPVRIHASLTRNLYSTSNTPLTGTSISTVVVAFASTANSYAAVRDSRRTMSPVFAFTTFTATSLGRFAANFSADRPEYLLTVNVASSTAYSGRLPYITQIDCSPATGCTLLRSVISPVIASVSSSAYTQCVCETNTRLSFVTTTSGRSSIVTSAAVSSPITTGFSGVTDAGNFAG